MYTLGVALSHHPCACLLGERGSPVSIEEAQLSGQCEQVLPGDYGLHPMSMPERSVEYCLSSAGIAYVDVDVIVFCDASPAASRSRRLTVADCVLRLPCSPQSRMLVVDPALAQAYSALHASGYDEAAILIISGSEGGAVRLGGAPGAFVPPLERADIFHASAGGICKLARVSRDQLDPSGARSSFEETMLSLSALALEKTGCTCLCLAGDPALNQALCSRIRHALPVSEVFVQPAVHDGTAFGAALYGWQYEQSSSLHH
ncbi:carbamoyltransferase N-terminal domain-containing protein [Dyella choica]|uniref:carbamoyltransferase N-terminal domain-containing protein n=1 Tax=Dyella choica TaxID=1927959 RepID=UPI0013156319|nr:carbamoyltransferase N-terminal domain-containing protein [Dyella choica]